MGEMNEDALEGNKDPSIHKSVYCKQAHSDYLWQPEQLGSARISMNTAPLRKYASAEE